MGQFWIVSQASLQSPCQVLEPWWIKTKPASPSGFWTCWVMAWKLACRAKWSIASDGGKAKLSGASANLTRADSPKRFLNILRFFTSSRTLCEVGKRNYFGAFVNLVALGTVFFMYCLLSAQEYLTSLRGMLKSALPAACSSVLGKSGLTHNAGLGRKNSSQWR